MHTTLEGTVDTIVLTIGAIGLLCIMLFERHLLKTKQYGKLKLYSSKKDLIYAILLEFVLILFLCFLVITHYLPL